MSNNKVNGLWAVNSSSVFMFFDSVNSPSVWRFEMKDGVESWRMVPGVGRRVDYAQHVVVA